MYKKGLRATCEGWLESGKLAARSFYPKGHKRQRSDRMPMHRAELTLAVSEVTECLCILHLLGMKPRRHASSEALPLRNSLNDAQRVDIEKVADRETFSKGHRVPPRTRLGKGTRKCGFAQRVD